MFYSFIQPWDVVAVNIFRICTYIYPHQVQNYVDDTHIYMHVTFFELEHFTTSAYNVQALWVAILIVD